MVTTRVLVVCTGNICRSPMAAALLHGRLQTLGVEADVASAGLLYAGRPASEGAIAAMAKRGLDIAAHGSRVISRSMVAAADLVIAMEPRHVREVVARHDHAWEYSFTLLELLQRCAAVTTGARSADESMQEWLRRAAIGRRRVELLSDDETLAILDPYKQDQLIYDATAADLDRWIGELVAVAWPASTIPRAERHIRIA